MDVRRVGGDETEVGVEDPLSWQEEGMEPSQSQWSLSVDEAARERRTQRTYRYGIALVCIGATLNWLGFAQGHGYVDPVRYVGVACVISGSLCVCMAMCRWLGRPIHVSSSPRLHPFRDEGRGSRQYGDVHVINVSVPIYTPSLFQRDSSTNKPPDYDTLKPPPYEEAIKLSLLPLPLTQDKNGCGESDLTPPTPSEQCTSRGVGVAHVVGTPPPPYHHTPSVHSLTTTSRSSQPN